MDKGEGLEQKSNDWESARRKHIDWGHIRKFWGRHELNLPSLKDKLKGNGKRMPINSKRGKAVFNWEKTINAKS